MAEKYLKLISCILTFLVVLSWYLVNSEAQPWSAMSGPLESSRFRTLREIAESSNNGYYFQVGQNIPMEAHWEDPGTGFLLSSWGIVKNSILHTKLNALKDSHRVEFFVILLILVLLYLSPIFSLPKWYWFIPPFFFALCAIPSIDWTEQLFSNKTGLLYLSIDARWAKVPAIFFLFTVIIQFYEWQKQNDFFNLKFIRFLKVLIFGLILGILISIRKDIFVPTSVSFLCVFLLFSFQAQVSAAKKIIAILCLGATLFAGIQAVSLVIKMTWKVRDLCYEMEDNPRIYGHPLWHSLYAALGKINNEKTITWGDEDAWRDISSLSENKYVQYGTKEHEKAAQKLYLRTIKKYPIVFLKNALRKTGHLIKSVWKLVFLNIIIFALLLFKRSKEWVLYLLLFFAITSTMIVPALVIPDIIYSLDFKALNILALMTGLIFLFKKRKLV